MSKTTLGGHWTTKIGTLTVVFLLGAIVFSCEGGGGGGSGGALGGGMGDECRSADDCSGDLYCRGPNQPNVCGIPPQEQCASDTDCPMGTVCHAVLDTCSQDAIGSQCNPTCTANSCGPDFRCNAGGACEPIPCDEGFTCPDRQKCDSAVAHANVAIFARTNGCVNIDCTSDAQCPSGKTCVTGYCQDGLGSCQENTPVP